MKRFKSAFAAPSGFAFSATADKAAKPARRTESGQRAGEKQGFAAMPAKPRSTRDVRDRAA